MATRLHIGGASAPPFAVPLDTLLAAIPSLPRALLDRLTARMIERLDEMDPEPDDEENGDAERTGDEGEPDYSAPRLSRSRKRAVARRYGPGCPISDQDYGVDDQGEEDRSDDEREQMAQDVPNCHVYALEPDPATGERAFLGWSNLSPAFVSGRPEREA